MTDDFDPEAETDPYMETMRSSCCGSGVEMISSGNSSAPTSQLVCSACGGLCGPVFVEDIDG